MSTAEQTIVDEIRLLAQRWVALWRETWMKPDDSDLDAANEHLYSTALAWINRPVVPEVVVMAAEWLRVAPSEAKQVFAMYDEDEICEGWGKLDREIIELHERIMKRV